MTRWSHILLNAVLILGPLIFGTSRLWIWSAAALCLIVFLSLVLFIAGARERATRVFRVPAVMPLILLALFHVLQLIPLPPEIIHAISPAIYAKYSMTIYIVDPSVWMPVSIAPRLTLIALLGFLTCLTVYWLTVQHMLHWQRLQNTLKTISWFIFIYAAFSIIQHLALNGKAICLLPALHKNAASFGTYINRNHYAGLMEMVMPLLIALYMANRPPGMYLTIREQILEFFNFRGASVTLIPAFTAILAAASIFIARSRSGMAITIFSLLMMGTLIHGHGRKEKMKGMHLAIIAVLAVSFVSMTGWQPVIERFETTQVEQQLQTGRPVSWQNSWKIVKEFITTGTGFGTFIDIYPAYQTNFKNMILSHAHNDYLESAQEGGVSAVLLMSFFLATLFFSTWKRWKKRANRLSGYTWAGSVTGITAILLHSMTDFNMHIGANRIWFFFLCGLAVAAVNGNSRHSQQIHLEPLDTRHFRVIATTAILTLLTALAIYGGMLTALYRTDSCNIPDDITHIDKTTVVEYASCLESAMKTDPWNVIYYFQLANLNLALLDKNKALDSYRSAIRYEPMNGFILQQTGIVMDYYSEPEKAELLLKAGTITNISRKEMFRNYAGWLFAKGRKTDGLRQVRSFLEIAPEETEGMLTFMTIYGINQVDMRYAMPEDALSYSFYGDFLKETGETATALVIYQHALRLLMTEKKPSTTFPVTRLAALYEKSGNTDKALEVLRTGAALFPDNPYLKIRMGGLYEKTGVNYRAVEEYRRALALKPDISWLKKRLNKLDKHETY